MLDLATGTGLIALQAAAAVGPTGSVTAVDISPGMLEQAKCKYQSSLQQPQQTLARTDFILGGFEQLDRCLDDKLRGCYDVIICSGAVPFLRDPKAAFRDWKLWLKPDGKLVFNAFEPLTEFRTFVQMAEQYGLQEKDPFDVLGSQQKIRDFLQHAGYCEVEVRQTRRIFALGVALSIRSALNWCTMATMPWHDQQLQVKLPTCSFVPFTKIVKLHGSASRHPVCQLQLVL